LEDNGEKLKAFLRDNNDNNPLREIVIGNSIYKKLKSKNCQSNNQAQNQPVKIDIFVQGVNECQPNYAILSRVYKIKADGVTFPFLFCCIPDAPIPPVSFSLLVSDIPKQEDLIKKLSKYKCNILLN
jgi:hypothetical protein